MNWPFTVVPLGSLKVTLPFELFAVVVPVGVVGGTYVSLGSELTLLGSDPSLLPDQKILETRHKYKRI